jgi:uncharacterized membrane protein YphA (DoxX/SURF4 family)
MFSMFPDGWPGTGLLLLRLATGVVLITQSVAYFGDKHELGFAGVALAALVSAVGCSLLIGFLTRFVAFAAAGVGIVGIFSWLPASTTGPLVTPTTAALCAVIAVAVLCLGPGALSLDARLFGRREIVIPVSSSRDDSNLK